MLGSILGSPYLGKLPYVFKNLRPVKLEAAPWSPRLVPLQQRKANS